MTDREKNSKILATCILASTSCSMLKTLVKSYTRANEGNLEHMINNMDDYHYKQINDRCRKLKYTRDISEDIKRIVEL